MIGRLRDELAYWRAVLAEKSYLVRPYDLHLDARRWRWQRSGRQRSYAALAALTPDQVAALEHAIAEHLRRRGQL